MTVQVHKWPEFDDALAKLKRKYPRIEDDLLRAFAITPEQLGARIVALPGFSHRLWKMRAGSSDMGRGKRGGFRIIFYLDPDPTRKPEVHLLTIYAKTERADIPHEQLMELFKRFWAYLRSSR